MKAEIIDALGSDLTVVNAARVSFDKHSEELTDKDRRLIRYLAEHGHWTPFSHAMITMRETVPIFVARQRFKHTVGFSYNEVSRRYVSDAPEFYIPEEWREANENKKQGSGGRHKDSRRWSRLYRNTIAFAQAQYETMIEDGVAPEMARMVLPQSMYTSYYVTGSLYAWARAYKLRSEEHAQYEIQGLAKAWDQTIRSLGIFDASWEALCK